MPQTLATFTLNDGSTLPFIGLGTYSLRGASGVNQLLIAFHNGYRLVDTSTNYQNEGAVGEAIRRSGLPREDFIVSSKLPGAFHAYDDAIKAIQESLYRLGLDYFDKYLIHWPLPKQGKYVEAWQALVDAQKFGLIKTIGVSNFLPEHLDRIIATTGVVPATNQIERHPYSNNADLVKADDERGILTEAWSPFGRKLNDVLENQKLQEIATTYHKTIPQVIIRWNLQNRVLPIVKSGSSKHQKENLDVQDFVLTDLDIAAIDSLDKGPAGRVEGQDPREYEEFD